MEINSEPIVVEQTYSATADVVWKAITDKDQMRQCYFETIPDFKAEIGFETEFNVRAEGRDFPHQWKVTEVVPLKRIAYEWRYGGYTGESVVTWELSESLDGTKLRLTADGIETFPQDDPMFTRESGEAGWEYFLKESLKEFLERQSS